MIDVNVISSEVHHERTVIDTHGYTEFASDPADEDSTDACSCSVEYAQWAADATDCAERASSVRGLHSDGCAVVWGCAASAGHEPRAVGCAHS